MESVFPADAGGRSRCQTHRSGTFRRDKGCLHPDKAKRAFPTFRLPQSASRLNNWTRLSASWKFVQEPATSERKVPRALLACSLRRRGKQERAKKQSDQLPISKIFRGQCSASR